MALFWLSDEASPAIVACDIALGLDVRLSFGCYISIPTPKTPDLGVHCIGIAHLNFCGLSDTLR